MSKTAEKRRVKKEITNILSQDIGVDQKLTTLNELFLGHEQSDYHAIVELVFRQHIVSILKQHSEMNDHMVINDPLVKLNDLLLLSFALASFKYVKKEGTDAASTFLRPPLISLMFADVFEAFPIQQASQWFCFVEDNITEISSLIVSEPQASAFLVRAFMTLLKRLSRSSDVAFCGRILMCLSKIMPLFDKSGMNAKGKINTKNVTQYQQGVEMPTDNGVPLSERLNKNFYNNFWKAVTYFQDCSSVQKSEQDWAFMVESVTMILDNFGANNETNCVLGPITNWDDRTGKNVSSGYFSPKYLTSPQLMLLEVTEPYFREHILIQMLIFFQGLKNKSDPSLTDTKREAVSEFEKRIKNLLSIFSTSDSKRISHSIEHVIAREQNWIQWKKTSCYPFNKAAETLDNIDVDVSMPPEKKPKLGNKNLGDVFDMANLIKTCDEHKRTPKAHDFLEVLIDEIDVPDGEKSTTDDTFQWRSNRLIAGQEYNSLKLMVEEKSEYQLEEAAKKIRNYQTPPDRMRPDHGPLLPPSLVADNNNNNNNKNNHNREIHVEANGDSNKNNKRKRATQTPTTEIQLTTVKKESSTTH